MAVKKAACVVGLLALAGCVAMKNEPVATGELSAYQGARLTVVTYQKPDGFLAMTSGKQLLGVLGALSELSAGNQIVQEFSITDPAPELSRKITAALSDRLKPSQIVHVDGTAPGSNSQRQVTAAAGNAGLVLDVQTVDWGFMYYLLQLTHYRVHMGMRARLIDAKTGALIAQGSCDYTTDEDNPPGYDEMLENNAARLKAMIQAGADNCGGTIQTAIAGP